MKWPWSTSDNPKALYPDSRTWAKAVVAEYNGNPIRFHFETQGSVVRIQGTVRQINPDGAVILWRDIQKREPRVKCKFQTLRMVADLDPQQEIVVEGELDDILLVERGPGSFRELLLVNCLWEEAGRNVPTH